MPIWTPKALTAVASDAETLLNLYQATKQLMLENTALKQTQAKPHSPTLFAASAEKTSPASEQTSQATPFKP